MLLNHPAIRWARANGPSALLALTIFALAAWRLLWIRLGPDPDSDSYGHHMIARQILVTPGELAVHWVWLPLFHYLQVPVVALGGGIDVVRFANAAFWAFVPIVLYVRLLARGGGEASSGAAKPASSEWGDLAPIVAAFLCALSPIGMQMGTTAQPEPLFCLCILGFLVAQDRGSHAGAALLLGAASMLRYEAWAVIGATALVVAIAQLRAKKLAFRPWLPVLFSLFLIGAWSVARRLSDHEWFFFLTHTQRFANDAMLTKGSLAGGGLRAFPNDLSLYTVRIPWKVMGPAVFLVPFGLVRTARTQGALFMLAYLATLAFLTLTWMTRSSLGLDRHFVVMVPFYATLAGNGVAQIAELAGRERSASARRRWAQHGAAGVAAVLGALGLFSTWGLLGDWMHEWRGALEHGWPDRIAVGGYLRTLPEGGTIFCDEATVEILSGIDRRRFDRHFLDDRETPPRIEAAANRDGVVWVASWAKKLEKLRPLGGEIVYRPPGEGMDADVTGLAVMRVRREGSAEVRK